MQDSALSFFFFFPTRCLHQSASQWGIVLLEVPHVVWSSQISPKLQSWQWNPHDHIVVSCDHFISVFILCRRNTDLCSEIIRLTMMHSGDLHPRSSRQTQTRAFICFVSYRKVCPVLCLSCINVWLCLVFFTHIWTQDLLPNWRHTAHYVACVCSCVGINTWWRICIYIPISPRKYWFSNSQRVTGFGQKNYCFVYRGVIILPIKRLPG